MKSETMLKVILVLVLIFGFSYIGMISIDYYNDMELYECKFRNNWGREVVFEDNLIFDRCLIIEDGEELTSDEYYEKHKYDGLEVRE